MDCLICGKPAKVKYCTVTCQNRAKFRKKGPEYLARARLRTAKNNKIRRNELRDWKNQYKLERGCCDCGYRDNPLALQFDHEGPKTRDVSQMDSLSTVIEEIEAGQCVIRCANCHAIKTWERKQSPQ